MASTPYKSFADRMAALEALEAAERQVEDDRPLDETDADDLDDDEVLNEAACGLAAREGYTASLTAYGGAFKATTRWPGWREYWGRVGERAQALCKERGICLFPLAPEEIRESIDLIERGVFTVHPWSTTNPGLSTSWRSHYSTIRHARYSDWAIYGPALRRLVHAMDEMCYQQQQSYRIDPLGSKDDVLAVLRWALGDDNEPGT
jgi:hypothetical protein